MLQGADFSGYQPGTVDFSSADLNNASLMNADIRGADLSKARNLLQAQIEVAKGDASTKLPQGLCLPRSWESVTANTARACPVRNEASMIVVLAAVSAIAVICGLQSPVGARPTG
jgi:hypothetical protein